MKENRRGSRGPRFVDPTFLEALDETESGSLSSGRQAERKTKQFSRQVQQALNLALADSAADSRLHGLFVEETLPAPDCGRLLVQVLVPEGQSVTEALAALGEQTPRLRSEVAAAIARKRAPQLSFVALSAEGASHE